MAQASRGSAKGVEDSVATDRTNQQVRLKDGRMLGYAEYGAPEGKPVFVFPGTPGSRLDWPGLVDNAELPRS